MTRGEEIRNAIDKIIPIPPSEKGRNYEQALMAAGFQAGAQWADDNPKSPWIKITEKIPPHQEPIIIAMKNKNKEDGIWLYDLCKFFGGDYTDNNNWEEKVNWEIPIYWMSIPKLTKKIGDKIMESNMHHSIIDRIKLCWAILLHKEFYACVVTSRYDDGSPLCIKVFCYGKNTITYKKKLIESLKADIKMNKFHNQRNRR